MLIFSLLGLSTPRLDIVNEVDVAVIGAVVAISTALCTALIQAIKYFLEKEKNKASTDVSLLQEAANIRASQADRILEFDVRVDNKDREIDSWQALFYEADKRASRSEFEIDSLKGRLAGLEAAIVDIDAIRQENIAMNLEISSFASIRSEVEKLKGENLDLRKENAHLAGEIEFLKEKVIELEKGRDAREN